MITGYNEEGGGDIRKVERNEGVRSGKDSLLKLIAASRANGFQV
jgi:hypothetical protein